jgi:hypothetical protein
MRNRAKKSKSKASATTRRNAPAKPPSTMAASKGETPGQLPLSSEAAALRPSGEVQVRYDQSPIRPPEGKHIHPRRPLPLVREGSLPEEKNVDAVEDRSRK